MNPTHPLTREKLLEHATAQLASMVSEHDRYVQSALIAMLEEYPLLQVAPTAVRIVIEDLKQRGGFREVFAECAGWMEVEAHIVKKVGSSIFYTHPLKAPKVETMELEFASEPAPVASGESFEFAE